MKLTVTIITFNEEKNIKRCLSSVKGLADEIILVDSGSTDKTLEIAEGFGAKIYKRKFDSDFSAQKNYAASKANGEWLFSLDADEIVPDALAKEIKEAIKNDKYDGYLVGRRNHILGKEIKHSRWSPDKHIWLWKKAKGSWRGRIHEEVVVKGKVGELKNSKQHYQHETVGEFFEMTNKYSSYDARELAREGEKHSFLKMIYFSKLSFFRRYIYKLGFLDGWRGFILAYLMGIYRLSTRVKLWEARK